MSSVRYSWETRAYKPTSALLFITVSFVAHAILAAFIYKTGFFTRDDIDHIASKAINVFITEPAPITPPSPHTPPVPVTPPTPIEPPKPEPKKIKKKKIVTQAPSKKQVFTKPKVAKKNVKPNPPKVIPKEAASPLPVPVKKPAVFVSPKPSYQPKPKYPAIARRRGVEGTVILEIFVANDGRVTQAMVIESSGSSALDRAALKTIKTWQFPPSQFNSLSSYKQAIEFRLNQY